MFSGLVFSIRLSDHTARRPVYGFEWFSAPNLAHSNPPHCAVVALNADVDLPPNYAELDEDAQDEAYNEATEGLTYTESGYLLSHEWFVSELHSPADLFDFLYA